MAENFLVMYLGAKALDLLHSFQYLKDKLKQYLYIYLLFLHLNVLKEPEGGNSHVPLALQCHGLVCQVII